MVRIIGKECQHQFADLPAVGVAALRHGDLRDPVTGAVQLQLMKFPRIVRSPPVHVRLRPGRQPLDVKLEERVVLCLERSFQGQQCPSVGKLGQYYVVAVPAGLARYRLEVTALDR